MNWPLDDIHKHLFNIARSIMKGKKSPGILRIIGGIQTSRIKGLHIIRYSSYNENGPYVTGEPEGFWLFRDGEMIEIDDPGEQKFYDHISSPFPRLYYALISEEEIVLNYVCGPRAGRGFICKKALIHDCDVFELSRDKIWTS